MSATMHRKLGSSALRRIGNRFMNNPRAAIHHYGRAVWDLQRMAFRPYYRMAEEALARLHFAKLGYRPLLVRRPITAIPPDWADLWFLYHNVRRRKPQMILEFGSGCSTIVLAQALLDNAREQARTSHLYSVDADPYWTEVTQRTLPDHLLGLCTVVYSPLQEVERFGVKGFTHMVVPAIVPNFVYLDGPMLTPERQVAFDVLDMELSLPTDFFLVVDGRTVQSQFLAGHLTRRYRIEIDTVPLRTIFEMVP